MNVNNGQSETMQCKCFDDAFGTESAAFQQFSFSLLPIFEECRISHWNCRMQCITVLLKFYKRASNELELYFKLLSLCDIFLQMIIYICSAKMSAYASKILNRSFNGYSSFPLHEIRCEWLKYERF